MPDITKYKNLIVSIRLHDRHDKVSIFQVNLHSNVKFHVLYKNSTFYCNVTMSNTFFGKWKSNMKNSSVFQSFVKYDEIFRSYRIFEKFSVQVVK